MTYLLLTLCGILVIIGSITLNIVLLYGYIKNKKPSTLTKNPSITILVPCKGLIPNLKQNLQSILNQNYSNYHTIFIIDTTQDPAYPIIQQLVTSNKNSKLIFTQPHPQASGKIAALLTGLHYVPNQNILVCADADITPHPNWLTTLITPLTTTHNYAATTGFRWFFPKTTKETLISTWNMATITSLFLPQTNYAWGGSMAIKKTLFDKLNIAHTWQTGLSDDLLLTQTLKQNHYQIKFVPQAISESPIDTTITSFIKWGTQQFTWMRWYYPSIYYITLISMILLHIFIALGFYSLIQTYYLPAILLLSAIPFELLYGLLGIQIFQKLLPNPKKKYGPQWKYSILMPIVFILYTYSLIKSATKKEIIWAGRRYRKKDLQKKG